MWVRNPPTGERAGLEQYAASRFKTELRDPFLADTEGKSGCFIREQKYPAIDR